jgi:hypothetical protein
MVEGKYTPLGTCPHCGRLPDFSDEATIADVIAAATACEAGLEAKPASFDTNFAPMQKPTRQTR